jgi:tetratricopeptide (TPR) repeat protein
MSMRNVGLVCLGLVVLALYAALPAGAQFGVYGQVKGKVIDPEGKPIVGAEVVFVNRDSGRTFKMKTDKRGEYFSQGLDQGEYDITVTKDGQQLGKLEKQKIYVGQMGDVNNPGFRNTIDFNFTRRSEKAGAEQADIEKAKAGYERAVLLNKEGKYEEALAELQPSLEKEGAQWVVHWQLAVAYAGLKRDEEAEASYKKAIELNPTEPKLYSVLGEFYMKRKRMEEARVQFETAANLSPEDAPLFWFNLAATFFNTGDLKSAIEPLNRVIELDPGHPNAHFFLGVALYNTAESKIEGGQVKTILAPGTREHFETYLALAPDGQYANDAKQYLQIIDATVPAAVRTKKK